jgi:nitrite reductase (NAD(P)H)
MTDLEDFGNVKLIDRNKWVLARQLDGDAGTLVTRKIRELGLDVLHQKRVKIVHTNDENNVIGITFEDGERIDCCCICFAVCVLLSRLHSADECADWVVDWSATPR